MILRAILKMTSNFDSENLSQTCQLLFVEPNVRTKELLQIKDHMGANIESERKGMYHLEATLTMSKTLPLYVLRLISFPLASCTREERPNANANAI